MKKSIKVLVFALIGLSFSACQKALELDPVGGGLEENEALQTKEDIQAFLNAGYEVTANYYSGRMQNLAELLSDNLAEPVNNNDFKEVYRHNTLVFNSVVGGVYGEPYFAVYRANRLMEVLDEKDFGYTPAEIASIKAECSFLRAIAHFEIVRLWAQPYNFTPSNTHDGIVYKTFSEFVVSPRPNVASNYENILSDLQAALTDLPEANGVYATKDAARGYLSKVYFQQGEYAKAAQFAGQLILKYPLHTSVDRFENKATSEVVFATVSTFVTQDQIDNRSGEFTNQYGNDNNTNPQLRMPKEFYDLYATDTNDRRVKQLLQLIPGDIPSYKITKFRRQYFDIPVIHTTDLRLLRAEALALSNGDLATAIADVNAIRERAYGGVVNNLLPSASSAQIIEAARFERRIEMVGEGDRIQQLKRRGAIEGEIIEIRDDAWDCSGILLQFPATEKTDVFPLNPGGGCN